MDTLWQGALSTLARRSRDRPILSVGLKISFRADMRTARAVKNAVPDTIVRNGVCVLKIEGEQPGEVVDRAREVLEEVRSLSDVSKGFK